PVPDVVARRPGEAQLRPRLDVHRPRALLIDAFEVDEEMQLVLDDRSAEVAAPLLLHRLRLLEVLPRREVVERRHLLGLLVEERRAVELVRALLRHGVDDAAGALAELGVELAGGELPL